MKKATLILFSFLLSINTYAQKHDYRWMMGSGESGQNSIHGTSHINFHYDPAFIYAEDTELNFGTSTVSISTEEGELIFYSNGIELHNAFDEPMANSEDFNYNEFHDPYIDFGLPSPQGMISMQSPGNDNLYHLFHLKFDYEFVDPDNFFFYTKGLYYTTIDMQGDGGKGEVIEKGIPIMEDTLVVGSLTATRHANGRDWWILMPELYNNRFYRILVDPEGVHLLDSQDLNITTEPDAAQATFSPDGNWYVRNNIVGGVDDDDYIDVYHFDRCSGMLSEHQRIVYGNGFIGGGAAVISPDSRYLYFTHTIYIYQLDLHANDIAASLDTVAVYDGFVDNEIFNTTFFLGQNAPDGKIYFNCTNGVSFLHIMHNPNGQGLDCRIEQHGVDLPTNNSFTLPNFPNYRLGPIDGSPCDTLGIDNIPLAAFNYYADSSDYLSINFWDYSFYEPTDWQWTFGDSGTGNGQTPAHTYAAPGIYEVCLTASNDNGSDGICKLIELSTTGIREILPEEEKVVLFPNPTSDQVTLRFAEPLSQDATFQLYNALGQQIKSIAILKGQRDYQLSLAQDAPGVYFYTVENEQGMISSGNLVMGR